MTVQPIKDPRKIKRMIAVLEKSNPRNVLLFRVGLNTILRIQDILDLRVSDIFHPDGSFKEYLSLFERKTKKGKAIKLNSLIRIEIKKFVDRYDLKEDDYIFFSLHNPARNLDRVEAWRILRKTLAWTIYQKTKDISLVMYMLNHQSPTATMKYLGLVQDSIDKTYEEFAIG